MGFGTVFTNTILLWIRHSEKKHGPPQKKTQKPPKRLIDFHDGISCQRFELECWGLVQCLLIVLDGINSVGDYNSSRVGVVCFFVSPPFFHVSRWDNF